MIKAITIKDPEYPKLLKETFNPPTNMYVRGNYKILNKPGIAIVGTRKNTAYGERATDNIAGELAKSGFVIISGLALGIDTIAHKSALKNNGVTIAVLGSSIDGQSIYPKENLKLAEEIIASGGAVISEYPSPTPPTKYTFPQRNRIVSGLSEATLVIEAPERSGALITARYALEQNREVFAVPGDIFSENSIGTNNLIKQGAKPITSAKEIISSLGIQRGFKL